MIEQRCGTADVRYRVRVVEGGMALGLTIGSLPRMRTADFLAGQIAEDISRQGLGYGLDFDALKDLLQRRVLNQEAIIARGCPPQREGPSRLSVSAMPPPWMDYAEECFEAHRQEITQEVKAGQLLARLYPGEPAQAGHNVLGQVLNPRQMTEELAIPAGRNTSLSPDGLELIATADGYPRWRNGLIDVVQANIRFGDAVAGEGELRDARNIEIYGSVCSGAVVSSGCDVFIFHDVEGGQVTSLGGSVNVRGAVIGTDTDCAAVTAECDIQVRAVSGGRLESTSGSIIVDALAVNSELRAARDILLRDGPAIDCHLEAGGTVRVLSKGCSNANPLMVENRRDSPRVSLNLPVAVEVSRFHQAHRLEGEVANLSRSGALLRMPVELRTGEEVHLELQAAALDGFGWNGAEVLRVAPADARAAHVYGLRFSGMDSQSQERLTRFYIQESVRRIHAVA